MCQAKVRAKDEGVQKVDIYKEGGAGEQRVATSDTGCGPQGALVSPAIPAGGSQAGLAAGWGG